MNNLELIVKESVVGRELITLAVCFKIQRKDGITMGFTTHTRDIKFVDDPVVYRPASVTDSSFTKSSQMDVDTTDIKMIINHDDIKQDDLEKGVFNNAKVNIFKVNWRIKPYLSKNVIKILDGTIGEVKGEDYQYNSEFRSKSYYLSLNIIDVTKVACRARFCDSKCKLNESDYTFENTVSKVDSNRVFYSTDLLQDDEYFNEGKLTFTSGDAKGQSMEVKYYTKDDQKIELNLSVNYNIKVGDTFKVLAGCDKSEDTCINKFNNVINHRGFPDAPSTDN